MWRDQYSTLKSQIRIHKNMGTNFPETGLGRLHM